MRVVVAGFEMGGAGHSSAGYSAVPLVLLMQTRTCDTMACAVLW